MATSKKTTKEEVVLQTTEEPKKTTTAKKATGTKKAAAAKNTLQAAISVQFGGKSYTDEELVKIAKDVWQYDLKKEEKDLKSIDLYVKPEESTVYYVFNKNDSVTTEEFSFSWLGNKYTYDCIFSDEPYKFNLKSFDILEIDYNRLNIIIKENIIK